MGRGASSVPRSPDMQRAAKFRQYPISGLQGPQGVSDLEYDRNMHMAVGLKIYLRSASLYYAVFFCHNLLLYLAPPKIPPDLAATSSQELHHI